MEVLEELLQLPLEAEITTVVCNHASNSVTFFVRGWGTELAEGMVSPHVNHVIYPNSSIVPEIGT